MIEALGLSIIFVSAFTTFLWFVVNIYFSLLLNLNTLVLTTLVSIFLNYLIIFRHQKLSWEKFKLSRLDFLLLFVLLGVLGINLVRNYYWPVSIEFDSVANYDYRALVFDRFDSITKLDHQYHVSYPLYTSLAHTAMYTLGFDNPNPFYSLLLWGYLLIFFSFLKSQAISTSKSILGCLLLITIPSVFYYAGIAYTNFPYLVFLSSSWLYLIRFLQKSDPKHLLYFCLLAAFSAWVRPANHPFFLTSIILLLLYRRNILLPILVYLSVYLPWYYFQNFLQPIITYETAKTLQGIMLLPNSLFLLPQSLWAIIVNLTDLKYSGAVGILFLFSSLVRFKKSIIWLVFLINLL